MLAIAVTIGFDMLKKVKKKTTRRTKRLRKERGEEIVMERKSS